MSVPRDEGKETQKIKQLSIGSLNEGHGSLPASVSPFCLADPALLPEGRPQAEGRR